MAWKSKKVYVAKHDFTATREDEVSLQAGDIVEVVNIFGDWWTGSVSGTSGVFPACFVHQLESTGRCTVIYPFTPRQEDEVELVVGEQVEMFGQVEPGTWAKGRVGNRVGYFPLNHVKQDAIGNGIAMPEAATPVQLRRTTNSKMRAGVRSVGPMSAALFDPEDEPVGPLFGSLSNKMAEASVGSVDKVKGGFLSKLRHSLGGQSSSKRRSMGGRQRLSSGSYLETQSVCSPAMARRNSISGFFGKMFTSSSRSSSKFSLHSLEEEQVKPNRLSRSWDPVCKLMPKKKTKNTEVVKIETDFRDMSLSPELTASVHKGRGSDVTLSCVWQEVGEGCKTGDVFGSGGKGEPEVKLARSDSGFGGSEDTSQAVEEPFGPMEDLTDVVFEDMFSPGKSKSPLEDPTDEVFEGVISPGASNIFSKYTQPFKGLTRNETATNPFQRWRKNETDKIEPITEL